MKCPSTATARSAIILAGIGVIAVHSVFRVGEIKERMHGQHLWVSPCSAIPPPPTTGTDAPSVLTHPFAWAVNLVAHAHHLNEPFPTCPRSAAPRLAPHEPRLYVAQCFANPSLWRRNRTDPCSSCFAGDGVPAAYHRYATDCTVSSHILRHLPAACRRIPDSAAGRGLFRASATEHAFDARTGRPVPPPGAASAAGTEKESSAAHGDSGGSATTPIGANPCAVTCVEAEAALAAGTPFLGMRFRVHPNTTRTLALAEKLYGKDVAEDMQAAVEHRRNSAPRHCTEGRGSALGGGSTPPLADASACEPLGGLTGGGMEQDAGKGDGEETTVGGPADRTAELSRRAEAGQENPADSSSPMDSSKFDPAALGEAADAADVALTERLLALQARANATRVPSFVVLLFDASPLWVMEEGLLPLAERMASCGGPDGQGGDLLAKTWRMRRFSSHNAIGLNTSPATLSLLSGAAPPDGTVLARIIHGEGAARRREHDGKNTDAEPHEHVSALDLFACVPELRNTHYCSDFAAEEAVMGPGDPFEPLHALLEPSHIRAHSNMWDSPAHDGGAAVLIDNFARGRNLPQYAPDHLGVGPFPNPPGYGHDPCTHPALQRHVDKPRFCADDSLLMAVDLDFLRDFDEAYRHVPTLSYDILYDTHENWDAVKQSLPAVTRRLERLATLVAPLKDVFVFISADHGPHNSHFADTPMHNHIPLWTLTPRRFETEFPQEAANLAMATAHRSTHRDLYETMRDLVDLYNGETLDRPLTGAGRSMLRPSFREPRSCAEAKIPDVFCAWKDDDTR